MKLSIVIKALNEEAHIADCLRSVINAVSAIPGDSEIVLADSLSSDRTVEISHAFGVKIVQLKDPSDRGCGSGVQLGYQHATGEYVYVLDGDMELQQDFLMQAVKLLDQDATLGGVAGNVRDKICRNYADRRRVQVKPSHILTELEWMDGGGLYRRKAITDAGGYAGNRNLKGFEEAELGLRIRHAGWHMVRLPMVSVFHTGHPETNFSMVLRLWKSGRLESGGVLLKTAFGRPWFLRVFKLFMLPAAVLLYWLSFVLVLSRANSTGMFQEILLLSIGGYLLLSLKKRSCVDACISIVLWHLTLIGVIRGFFFNDLKPAQEHISSVILTN